MSDELDNLTDREFAEIILTAMQEHAPDALFHGGFDGVSKKMLMLIDGDFELVAIAESVRNVLQKQHRRLA